VGLLRRRRTLPARLRPPIEPEERVLAWARVAAGGASGAGGHAGGAPGAETVIVATNRGLWTVAGTATAVPVRLGWHEIHKVTWSGRRLTVTPAREVAVAEGYRVMADEPTVGYLLSDPDRLPEHVRTRVNRSVAYTEHHPLPSGGGARVVARRVSGVDGLHWAVRYDPGTDPQAPGVAAETAVLVERARVAALV